MSDIPMDPVNHPEMRRGWSSSARPVYSRSVAESLASSPTTPQPVPRGTGREIAPLVMAEIEARVQLGRSRYGESLRAFNGRSAIRDALDEALDQVFYLRQVLEEERNPDEAVRLAQERGWVAGILDGEGSLLASVNKNGSVAMSLVVVNTDRSMLEKLASVTGVGHVYEKKRQPRRMPVFHWYVSKDGAAHVLTTVRPLLTTKALEADLWLELWGARKANHGKRATDQERALAESVKAQKRVRNGVSYERDGR